MPEIADVYEFHEGVALSRCLPYINIQTWNILTQLQSDSRQYTVPARACWPNTRTLTQTLTHTHTHTHAHTHTHTHTHTYTHWNLNCGMLTVTSTYRHITLYMKSKNLFSIWGKCICTVYSVHKCIWNKEQNIKQKKKIKQLFFLPNIRTVYSYHNSLHLWPCIKTHA